MRCPSCGGGLMLHGRCPNPFCPGKPQATHESGGPTTIYLCDEIGPVAEVLVPAFEGVKFMVASYIEDRPIDLRRINGRRYVVRRVSIGADAVQLDLTTVGEDGRPWGLSCDELEAALGEKEIIRRSEP